MDTLKASLCEEELRQINAKAKKLKEFQNQQDPPEAASALPRLNMENIPKSIEKRRPEIL